MRSPITKQCGSIYSKYVCVYVWCINMYKIRNIYLTSLQFWVSLVACFLPSYHTFQETGTSEDQTASSGTACSVRRWGSTSFGSRERAVGLRPGVKQHLWLLSRGWEWVFTVHLAPGNSHCIYRDGWVANKTRLLKLQMGRAMPCHRRDAIKHWS